MGDPARKGSHAIANRATGRGTNDTTNDTTNGGTNDTTKNTTNRRAPASILLRAAELAAADEPFALATVVAALRPTSAKPGSHGIVHPDRSVEGWVGGSCARPTVIREALRSLADGRARLIRLSPTGDVDGREIDGVVEYAMTCHSGGTLEIFIEPHLPAPALWVAGTTPIAGALVDLGAAGGFRVTLADPDAAAEAFPSAHRVVASDDLASLETSQPPYVVVATQGQWDEDAVEAALRRECAYVGLVASPRRATSVRDYLHDRNLPDEAISRLHAPAGLDLGAKTPEEVAISILAELVQLRRTAEATTPGLVAIPIATGSVKLSFVKESVAAGEAQARQVADPGSDADASADADIVLRDPVCGMRVDLEAVRYRTRYGGTVYAFCCQPCRTRFLKDPDAFVQASTPAG